LDRLKKRKVQQLRKMDENIVFHNGECVEDFTLRLTSLVAELTALGDEINKQLIIDKMPRHSSPIHVDCIMD
jgi:hypothetical protein